MKRILVALLALAAIVAAGPAAAKEPGERVPICGPDACVRTGSGLDLAYADPLAEEFLVSPPPLQPYYVARFRAFEPHHLAFLVPGANAYRSGFNWAGLGAPRTTTLLEAIAGAPPFPKP